jgi:hypothetical protein
VAHLGNYLTTLVEVERKAGLGTTATSLADRMAVPRPLISRLMNSAAPIGMNRETIERMVNRISKDPSVKAGLLIAYLKDQLVGDAADSVQIKAARATDEPPCEYGRGPNYDRLAKVAAALALNHGTLRAIEQLIRGCAKSKRFCRSVRDLADVAEHDILPEK